MVTQQENVVKKKYRTGNKNVLDKYCNAVYYYRKGNTEEVIKMKASIILATIGTVLIYIQSLAGSWSNKKLDDGDNQSGCTNQEANYLRELRRFQRIFLRGIIALIACTWLVTLVLLFIFGQ